MNPKLWLNRNHLLYNLRHLKKHTNSPFVCPMVKANAYGAGDSLVVASLLAAEIKNFGVARTFEAEKLRRNFPNDDFDILVFQPLVSSECESFVQNKLTAVVSSFEDLKLLEALDTSFLKQLKPIHLKFDLGMNRLGFDLSAASEVEELLGKLNLTVGGVCGHFSSAGDYGTVGGKSEGLMADLIKTAHRFNVTESNVHVPNSEALLKGRFDVGIRPGISLYGVANKDEGLKGALKLTAPVVSVREVKKGDSVSYSGTWSAETSSKLAILPIGYADGLRRGLSNRINFRRNGVGCKQVGTICMDYCMVILEKSEQDGLGTDFTLFDEDFDDLYKWSDLLNTIPYEILTGLGNRIERRVI